MDSESTVYYFGYGSNMDTKRMQNHHAEFTERVPARLPGYRFTFNKIREKDGTAAANIIPDENSTVHGALYTCSMKSVEALDPYELTHKGHATRILVSVYLNDDQARKAYVYVANPKQCDDNIKKVNRDYMQHVLAAKDILPNDYYSFLKSFETMVVD